jgi:glycine/D-amino acid oxidase-like deaminating enzyme
MSRLSQQHDHHLNPQKPNRPRSLLVPRRQAGRAQHYIRGACRAGAQVFYGVKVTQPRESGDRIIGVNTTAGPVSAPTVVVAAGVWTSHLTKTVGVRIPIMPVIMSELETVPTMPLFAPRCGPSASAHANAPTAAP